MTLFFPVGPGVLPSMSPVVMPWFRGSKAITWAPSTRRASCLQCMAEHFPSSLPIAHLGLQRVLGHTGHKEHARTHPERLTWTRTEVWILCSRKLQSEDEGREASVTARAVAEQPCSHTPHNVGPEGALGNSLAKRSNTGFTHFLLQKFL